MPLPTVELDDRRFEDIVDQAKRLIPQYCPEWTDHNVSDPGVAMIELFAWMTELLLYRVNQVPDLMYVRFLEMMGVQLTSPVSASVPITFYSTAPQPTEMTIPSFTEVATLRTETQAAIIFSTNHDLIIRPVRVMNLINQANPSGLHIDPKSKLLDKKSNADRIFYLGSEKIEVNTVGQKPVNSGGNSGLQTTGGKMFSDVPKVDDRFLIAFEDDHSHHVLAVVIECDRAAGTGIDPDFPPLAWEVLQSNGRITQWVPCEVEVEGTWGFNRDGEIVLRLPKMHKATFEHENAAFWLSCRVAYTSDKTKGLYGYEQSPRLKSIRIESRGAIVQATHAVTVTNEHVGLSNGIAGQRFALRNKPILTRATPEAVLHVQTPGHELEVWTEVRDFADSQPGDRHYTLDTLEGTIQLPPALIQPDATLYVFGAIPAKGASLTMPHHQYGGGVIGNVAREAISVLKTSIPYVARVVNWQASVGGRDAQSLEDAKLRAPKMLRNRSRAVTASDYVFLTSHVLGVARAHCAGAGNQLQPISGDIRPGHVIVSVLPDLAAVRPETSNTLTVMGLPEKALAATVATDQSNMVARIADERMQLSAELKMEVQRTLEEVKPLGITLDVRQVSMTRVRVVADIKGASGVDPKTIEQQALERLHQFLNPYSGGNDGNGWPFGRALHKAELISLLSMIPNVEFVRDIEVMVTDAGSGSILNVDPRYELPANGLLVSETHQITVVTTP